VELIVVDSAQTPLNHGPLQQEKPRNMQVNMLLLSNKEPLTKILKLASGNATIQTKNEVIQNIGKKKFNDYYCKYLILELGMNKVITFESDEHPND
jgi:dsDNA-binding SOS-regulon protein